MVMYGCESWTIKKAERRRINAFWTARKSNQSILKEISPGCSLEGLMLKLKLQYFGHLMRRADSLEKTLILGKIEGRRRRGWQRMRWLDGITDSKDMVWVDSRSWWWTGKPGVLGFMGSQRVGTRLSDWTELNWIVLKSSPPSPWKNYLPWSWSLVAKMVGEHSRGPCSSHSWAWISRRIVALGRWKPMSHLSLYMTHLWFV